MNRFCCILMLTTVVQNTLTLGFLMVLFFVECSSGGLAVYRGVVDASRYRCQSCAYA